MTKERVGWFLMLVLLAAPVGAAEVYLEDFDDGSASDQVGPPEACWYLYGADNPIATNTPFCMGYGVSRTLRLTGSSTYYAIFGIDLSDCVGPASMEFTYFQDENNGCTVNRKTASSGSLDCDQSTFGFTTMLTLTTTDSCMTETVALVPGELNYIMLDSGHFSNAIWFDDWSVEADCSSSCRTDFDADFGTYSQSGTVCERFPDLWEACEEAGPYLSTNSPCGGTGDACMALAQGYPYSTVQTACLDLTGLGAASFTYSYSWDGFASLSPEVEISTDGGAGWSTLKAQHESTGGASCEEVCLDLGAYVGQPDVRLRISSNSSSSSYYAYFDDFLLQPGVGCPTATPTTAPTLAPTQTPTEEPTEAPTDVPTETPTPTFSPTEEPTETPTASPTESPTQTPTLSPTSSPSATTSPTPTPTIPLPVPAQGPLGIALLVVALGGLMLRRRRG